MKHEIFAVTLETPEGYTEEQVKELLERILDHSKFICSVFTIKDVSYGWKL